MRKIMLLALVAMVGHSEHCRSADGFLWLNVIANTSQCEINKLQFPCTDATKILRDTLKVPYSKQIDVVLGGNYGKMTQAHIDRVKQVANDIRKSGYTNAKELFMGFVGNDEPLP
jgi:hypothetical protein